MASLLYRPDLDAVRERLRTFWDGGEIGRPALLITCPRAEQAEQVETPAAPPGWITDYSTTDFGYRARCALPMVASREYLAEAIPVVAPHLAPNCLALYLGCRGVEMPGTVWCEPFIADPEKVDLAAIFRYDPENFYWRFSSRLGAEQKRLGKGKWLMEFPDLIEGLDTLGAMRGTEGLLLDLYDRPEWVQACLRRITDLYFHYYDLLYDLMRDDVGGSVFWCWAPGRMAKFQCDFSAMIGPDAFRDFMLPVLREMTERVSYCMYHWDGPGAIPHHDHLLALPDLDMIQWTPGSGHPPVEDREWWPLYHKTVEAGKKLYLAGVSMEGLGRLRREFGSRLARFLIGVEARDAREAREAITLAEC